MRLIDLFEKDNVIRDIELDVTHYATSLIPNTFTFALNLEFINKANNNVNVVGVITTKDLSDKVDSKKGLVISENVKKDFFELHNFLCDNNFLNYEIKQHISSSARIASTVMIGKNVFIGDDVEIGHYSIIEENSFIGNNTIIGPHVAIGTRGLHNTRISDNDFIHVQDAGGVKIGNNCEVLAGCVIQRSYFCEATIIGDQTKLGPKVNVGHGTKIGDRCLIAGGTVIAGFNTIGNDVWIGPSSVLAHGLMIENNVNIKLGSVVITNVQMAQKVSGNFAYDHKKHLRNFTKMRNGKKNKF